MYANKSITSRATTTSSSIGASGPKGMMNSYFASKGLDLSPSKSGSNKSKKGSSHVRPPPLKSIQKQISPKILESIRIYFTRKVDSLKNELVSVFQLEKGSVVSFHLYKSDNDYFELTERRRQLLFRYYGQGSQFVLLYLNQMNFEHYLPVSMSALNKIIQSASVLPMSANTGSAKKFLCKSKSMTTNFRLPNCVDNRFSKNNQSSTQSSKSNHSFPPTTSQITDISQKLQSFSIADNCNYDLRPISSVYSKSYPQTFVHSCSTNLPEGSNCKTISQQ